MNGRCGFFDHVRALARRFGSGFDCAARYFVQRLVLQGGKRRGGSDKRWASLAIKFCGGAALAQLLQRLEIICPSRAE